MANARLIRKRIRSVRNTAKITRTMELVSTAKAKRAQDRAVAARPFARELEGLLAEVRRAAGAGGRHPFLEERTEGGDALLVVTANRGLCGGYNAGVLRRAAEAMREAGGEGIALFVVGKKGAAYYRYLGRPVAAAWTDLPDGPRAEDAERFFAPLAEGFLGGRFRRVRAVSMRFLSASRQQPVVHTLLPVTTRDTGGPLPDLLWDPAPGPLLETLLPRYVRTDLLRILMEHAVSEQIARRLAMKNATENANEMRRSLTKSYNRARQGQITQQIAEIVGGAEALQSGA